MYEPDHFLGVENVRNFFKKYNKVSEINGWNEEDKIKFLSIFVNKTASTFLENLEYRKENWTWSELQNEFIYEFQPVGYDIILKTQLENRFQGNLEPITTYINDIEYLCRQINLHMKEEEICSYILNGLKEDILWAISMLDNSTIKKLKDNIRKFELMQFRINNRHPGVNEYNELLNKHVTQIRRNDNTEKDLKIDRLKKELNKLSDDFNCFNTINESNNQNVNFNSKNNINYSRDDRRREQNYERYNDTNRKRKYRFKSPYPEKFLREAVIIA